MWFKRRSEQLFTVEGRAVKRRREVKTRELHTEERLFHATPERERAPLKKRLMLLLSILGAIGALAFLVYLVFFSHVFDLQAILAKNIGQDKTLTSEEIEAELVDLKGHNLFTLSTAQVATKILDTNARIKRVEVSRILPRTLEVEFTEYPVAALFNTVKNGKQYLINEAGLVVGTDVSASSGLLNIQGDSEEIFDVDVTAVPRKDLAYIRDSVYLFEKKTGLHIVIVHYYGLRREVHLETEKGFEVWFDVRRPPEAHIDDFTRILSGTDLKNSSFSVIDLRIPGKAFICQNADGCGN